MLACVSVMVIIEINVTRACACMKGTLLFTFNTFLLKTKFDQNLIQLQPRCFVAPIIFMASLVSSASFHKPAPA